MCTCVSRNEKKSSHKNTQLQYTSLDDILQEVARLGKLIILAKMDNKLFRRKWISNQHLD